MIALLLAVQAVPQSLLDASDNAAAAYVQCLFAESRAAHGAQLGPEAFERKLATSCLGEEEAVVRTALPILKLRGVANPASVAREEAHDARDSVVDTYRQTLSFRP